MAMSPPANIAPPIVAKPLHDDGDQHSQPWSEFYQSVADRVNTAAQQITDLTTQLGEVHQGVVDGSDAAPGTVGEYMSGTSGAVALPSGALTNVISLDLTAGDWDVSGSAQFSVSAGTHILFAAGIDGLDGIIEATFPTASLNQGINTQTLRHSITTTTTVWLKAEVSSTATTRNVIGSIRARRMR